jgi:hypothetical protein
MTSFVEFIPAGTHTHTRTKVGKAQNELSYYEREERDVDPQLAISITTQHGCGVLYEARGASGHTGQTCCDIDHFSTALQLQRTE